MTQPSVWNCHPDLKTEWDNFITESQLSGESDLNSDLWMNFWNRGVSAQQKLHKPANKNEDDIVTITLDNEMTPVNNAQFETHTPSLPEKNEAKSPGLIHEAPLSDSQLKQINSLVLELVDVVEVANEELSEDLREEISSLSHLGVSQLLQELGSQLSDQGAYNLCLMLSDPADTDPWISVPLIFEHLLLSKLCGNGHGPAGAEIVAGIIHLSQGFPSECNTHLLKPLLSSQLFAPSLLQLLSRLVPSLPKKDFISLLRYVVDQCNSPIDERQASILNSILSNTKMDFLEEDEVSPLHDLLPILSSSARAQTASESFASLLLKVIPVLKRNMSSRVQNDLMMIVQQNSSFNKQALINALKTQG